MARFKHKVYCLMAAGILMSSCGGPSHESEKQSDNPIMNVAKLPMAEDGIVRLSRIQVYPEYLEEYLDYAVTVGETSLKTEPGVLTMYAMQDKSDSCSITILESYSSQEAYRQHIESKHFQRYKREPYIWSRVLSYATRLH